MFTEPVEFTGMEDERVRLELVEPIQDCGRVGASLGPRKVKRLDVSAKRREVGMV